MESLFIVFFLFFQIGQLTSPLKVRCDSTEHLTFADTAVNNRDNPTILGVQLKASKADPFRSGVDVFVGKSGNDLCPVIAMVNYIVPCSTRQQRWRVVCLPGQEVAYQREPGGSDS
jgi:hypothetical protein